MSPNTKFYIADPVRALFQLANVSPTGALSLAGLPQNTLTDTERGISANETFALWTALLEMSDDPYLPVTLARRAARIQIVPTLMAYLLSSTVKEGLQQLAIFKKATGPFLLDARYVDNEFCVSLTNSENGQGFPKLFGLFETVYIVELVRLSTATHVIPNALHLPESLSIAKDFFNVEPIESDQIRVVFSKENAQRALVTANAGLLNYLTPTFEDDLAKHQNIGAISEKVGSLLEDKLSEKPLSLASVARMLGRSPRALQRALKSEGLSFEEILRQKRMELAIKHLTLGQKPVAEIAAKLGYSDPNSFYRAFQKWTGLTPSQVRQAKKMLPE